jgi:hypothetical protein
MNLQVNIAAPRSISHLRENVSYHTEGYVLGCLWKCPFVSPRKSEFYTGLIFFRVNPRNLLLLNSAEFLIGS